MSIFWSSAESRATNFPTTPSVEMAKSTYSIRKYVMLWKKDVEMKHHAKRYSFKVILALIGAMVLVLSQSASAQTRENFTLDGLSAFVITPNSPAPGNPWIAYAPAVSGLPAWTGSGEEKWMFDQYFAAGIAVAGIYSGDLSGNPTQRAGYTDLYNELVGNRGYADQFSFHTRSRGGLLGYNWAADNPGKVAAIGGIYPATNLLSYPGATVAARHYGVTVTELYDDIELYNPIERLAPLASSGVKLFHIHGNRDRVVPLDSNSQITKDRYDALGGDMTLKVIVGGGHDGNDHWWTDQQLTDFMINETLAATVPEPASLLLAMFSGCALLQRRRQI
jgi:hypothetical protein